MFITFLSRRLVPRFAALLAVSAVGAGVSQAQINYGDFTGSTVSYMNVTEDSVSGTLPLYGAPSLAVDTLDFDPTFGVFSSGGGSVNKDGALTFDISANSGYVIEMLSFAEAGDLTLDGVGTANTYVDVNATFSLKISEVDGVAITPVFLTNQMVFSPNANGTFDLVSEPGDGSWSGALNFDITTALLDANLSFLGGATKLSVTLDNLLYAQSESGTLALIAKKDFDALSITAQTTVVPEPSTAVLGLLAMGGLGYGLRRRKLN